MPSGGEGAFTWTEVRLEVPSSFEDLAVGFLSDEAPSGCVVERCGQERVRLIAHVRDRPEIAEVLQNALMDVGCRDVDCAIGLVANQDWMATWMESFVPIRVSDRVWVRPPWHECEAGSGEVVVTLNPGLAFGTGHHESTRIALGFVDGRTTRGGTYLDLGCGTGILAIAALLLGAGHVALAEVDPEARTVAERELARNGVQDRTAWVQGPRDITGLDGVFMNITSDVIGALMPAVAGSLVPGGWVAVSGILLEQAAGIRDRGRESGLVVVGERRDGSWWGALMEKR